MHLLAHLRLLAAICTTATCLALPMAHAKGPASLEGVWKEVDDEQTTSVLRFEKSGTNWVGKYLQVGAYQAGFGFSVGEAIIRGQLEGTRFTGQVLLKNVNADPACPAVGVGWMPVRMDLVQSRQRLHGAFLGTLVEEGNECRITGRHWRQYRLQRAE